MNYVLAENILSECQELNPNFDRLVVKTLPTFVVLVEYSSYCCDNIICCVTTNLYSSLQSVSDCCMQTNYKMCFAELRNLN